MKGFVIYLPSQKTELAHFLAQADGCDYTAVVSVSSELVSQLGGETVFNLSKAKAILHREITVDEIANTLSHIECWRKIAADETIADNEFAIVAEADLQLSPNYFSAL
ncbi:glycosyltransferase family 25 protein [Haemophilus sputorum]|uniref:glycosyltransferase family 25 protein n=1 Tax=Haemophilus sputorum TaxID=1078480 RepID=UPI001CED34B0|nr:glycosyltransferase family 25 protein [Haemophilus sputorum]